MFLQPGVEATRIAVAAWCNCSIAQEHLRERAEVDTLVAQIADENEKERKAPPECPSEIDHMSAHVPGLQAREQKQAESRHLWRS